MESRKEDSEIPASALRVLLIEDCAEDATAVERDLVRSRRPRFSLASAPTWAEARPLLTREVPDVVLLDLHLPDAEGLELVRAVVDSAPGVPIVIMTGVDEDQVALQALQLGAQDYLVKSDVGGNALRRAIRHAIERQQILESLEQVTRERIEMKNNLLNHVSHELLTPLSAIYQFIDILRGTLGGNSENVAAQQKKCLDVLLRNAVQLRRMIGDLMEATRIETGKLQLDLSIVDVRAGLEHALRSAAPEAERKQLVLRSQLADGLPAVLVDEARLAQITANLLSNAIKFTPSGGSIEVRAERSPHDPERVHICVTDTGRGISAEALPHVFERLYQERESASGSRKGLGLGLYICKEIVAQLGGRIWAESEFGSGSRFHVELPAYSTERLFAENVNPQEPATLVALVAGAPDPASAARAPEELLSEIHSVLPRLVLNHFDVVLPRRKTPGGEVLGVVARTDGPGAAAMGARFERQIRELRDRLAADVPIAVRTVPLACAGRPECRVGELAAEVERTLEALRRGEVVAP